MGEYTLIEWCDSTTNPSTGCEGCELWNGRDIRHCYAGTFHEGRLAHSIPRLYAPNFQDVRLAPGRMMKAARWSDLRGLDRPTKPWLSGMKRMIFVGDMGDFLSRQVPDDYFVNEILGAITSAEGSRHIWMLLTKQIDRLMRLSEQLGGLPDNVVAMTTVTSQATANARLPRLLATRARYRAVSVEPLLEEVDLRPWLMEAATPGYRLLGRYYGKDGFDESGSQKSPALMPSKEPLIQLVICGGESGADARLMRVAWASGVIDQCHEARIAAFFKQAGKALAAQLGMKDKKKGGDYDELPALFKLRQFPPFGEF